MPASPGTGVFGTGDHIGVAGSSGSGRALYLPLDRQHIRQSLRRNWFQSFPFDPPPQLPRLGRAGDVLAATVQIDEVNIARLWFCAIGNRNPACALGRDFVQPNDSGYQPIRNQPARYPRPGMGSGLSGMRNIVRRPCGSTGCGADFINPLDVLSELSELGNSV